MNKNSALQSRESRVYIFLVSLIICGLASSLITAPKVVHFGINFPFSNIIFATLTYPVTGCICELWGKAAAKQALCLGLLAQTIFSVIIHISIVTPHAAFWSLQSEYHAVLSTGLRVAVGGLLAFGVSQLLDIIVYQHVKELSHGRWMWLRSNLSAALGQVVDSVIFIGIVFFHSDHLPEILLGSVVIKVILSFLMTPVVYLIVISADRYLKSNTLAFK